MKGFALSSGRFVSPVASADQRTAVPEFRRTLHSLALNSRESLNSMDLTRFV